MEITRVLTMAGLASVREEADREWEKKEKVLKRRGANCPVPEDEEERLRVRMVEWRT